MSSIRVTGQQIDLFVHRFMDGTPFKGERNMLEFPFFSLSKNPRMTPMIFDNGRVKLRIDPSSKGIANIWDSDFIIFLGSVINKDMENGKCDDLIARMEQGERPSMVISFPACDFLKVTGRSNGKRAYDLFKDMLFRLRATTISTDIETGGEGEERGFGWIGDYRIVRELRPNGHKIMKSVEVVVSHWLVRAFLIDQSVLTLNPLYFKLKGGLERRLYMLARKHCGSQSNWEIGLIRLADKSGSTREVRKFKADLNKIIEEDSLLDYVMEFRSPIHAKPPGRSRDAYPIVVFRPRGQKRSNEVLPPLPETGRGVRDVPSQQLQISMRCYERARQQFSGYDIYALENNWKEWVSARIADLGEDERPKNPDAAFLGWARKYVAGNPIPFG